MQAYVNLVNRYLHKLDSEREFYQDEIYERNHLRVKTSNQLFHEVKTEIPNYLLRRELVIDELGREPLSELVFGNELMPVVEFLLARYSAGAITHATTNFKMETLAEKYGPIVADRLRAMFEIIVFNGESKRQ